jgi:hypothetical protein
MMTYTMMTVMTAKLRMCSQVRRSPIAILYPANIAPSIVPRLPPLAFGFVWAAPNAKATADFKHDQHAAKSSTAKSQGENRRLHPT